jgi:ubiquinone/menaquinone biosynthesis C-methylase UbiE
MVPEAADRGTFWEHIYRYRFAAQFVQGKRLLDIACGEGYGLAALVKAGAKSAVGVDISEEACLHARKKYGVDARQGSAESIPLSDDSVDVIISFETIEHVEKPGLFLDECVRVLAPGGTLIISTPNKGASDYVNPFHCSELTEQEFRQILQARFQDAALYAQTPVAVPQFGLRSLAVENLEYRLLRRIVKVLFTPHLIGDPSEAVRTSPVSTILGKDSRFSTRINPFAVQQKTFNNDETASYFVAVARLKPD